MRFKIQYIKKRKDKMMWLEEGRNRARGAKKEIICHQEHIRALFFWHIQYHLKDHDEMIRVIPLKNTK